MAQTNSPAYFDPERGAKTREDFLKNEDFLEDAQQTLYERTGVMYEKPEEIVDEVAELFRFSTVNEYTALMNLNHVRKSDEEAKERFGRMYLSFENSDGMTSGWEKTKDYLGGVASAPSTIVTVLTAGLGGVFSKAAGIGLKAVPQKVMSKLAKDVADGEFQRISKKKVVAKAAAKAGAFEGAVGTLQGYAEGSAKKETGIEEYEDVNIAQQMALFGTIGAASGGAIAAPLAARRLSRDQAVAKRAEIALNTKQAAEKEAVKEWSIYRKSLEGKSGTRTNIKTGETTTYDVFKEAELVKEGVEARVGRPIAKGPLSKDSVEKGEELKNEMFPDLAQEYRAMFSEDVHKNMISAASEIIMKAGLRASDMFITKADGTVVQKRITEILTDALDRVAADKTLKDGQIVLNKFEPVDKILKKYSLSTAQFRHLIISDVSSMGRGLGQYGRATKELFISVPTQGKIKEMREAYKRMEASGFISPQQREQFDKMLEVHKGSLENASLMEKAQGIIQKGLLKVYTGIKVIDKARLGLMTIQLATTIRNTANGTARLALYALDNFFHGVLTRDGSRMMAGPRALASMINPEESNFLRLVYSQSNPDEFGTLFKQMADIDTDAVANSKFVGISRFLNGLNTMADNAFKRSIFLAELQARVGKDALQKHMDEMTFSAIDEKDLAAAAEEALSFTYQKSYKNQGGGFWEGVASKFIKTFSVPVASNAIPFPRFIANSLEFMYKHAPIIGLADIGVVAARQGRQGVAKRVAQNVTGMGMLYGAIQLRAQQGPHAKWWEMYDEDEDRYKNALAFYGPFAPWMLLADIIVRSTFRDATLSGKKIEAATAAISSVTKVVGIGDVTIPDVRKKWQDVETKGFIEEFWKEERFIEFIRAAFGSQFKAGLGADFIAGFMDRMARANSDLETGMGKQFEQLDAEMQTKKNEKYLKSFTRTLEREAGLFLGNLFNSFTVSGGMAKDILATLDPKEWADVKQTDSVSPIEAGIRKSLRSMPINSEGKYFGLFSSKDAVNGMFKLDEGTEAQDVIVPTDFPGEKLIRERGVARQLTGLSDVGRKNAVEKELAVRNLEAWKLFPVIRDDTELNTVLKKFYQLVTKESIFPAVIDPRYKNLSPDEKPEALKRIIRKALPNPLKAVEEILARQMETASFKDLPEEEQERIDNLHLRAMQHLWNAEGTDKIFKLNQWKKDNKGQSPDLDNKRHLKALIQSRVKL